MKMGWKVAFCFLVLLVAGGMVASGQVMIAKGKTANWDQLDKLLGPVKASKHYTIGAIEKTLINEHWQEMAKGYQDEAKVLGVTVDVGAAKTESSLTEQLDLAETMLSKNYDALCVSPLAETNLVSALEKAAAKKIPIVNVDDARITSVPNVFVGANHKQMGVLAGEYFAKVYKGKGPVEAALIEGMSGSSASIQRIQGFREAVSKSPDLKLVASQPGDWDRMKSLNAMENILQAHPNVKVVYACNDTMALGAIEAIINAGKLGQIMVIGTDGVPDAQQSVKSGQMTGTIAAFPYAMGQIAADVAVRLLEGQQVPEIVVSPMVLVTKDNYSKYFK
jgi:ABC-type sugar transport system substrate-binding protein